MASLKKRGDVYYIRFFKNENGKKKRKAFSLGTTIKREAQGKPSDGCVFPSATGLNRFHGMTPGALSRSFKKFVNLAKTVPNSVTLHGLRHSCAMDLLRKGVPIC